MKTALIIDIQSTQLEAFPSKDRKYYLKKWKDNGTPVHIALTPYQRSNWQMLESDIGDLVTREGSGLLLEGLIHTCWIKNHTIRDPHHEHICTSFLQRSSSYPEQLNTIYEGISFLEKIFGIKPSGFVPPQHLWNEETRKAVERCNMKYLVTSAMFDDMYPYKEGNVVIVPSASMKKSSRQMPVMHAYYDRIKDSELFEQIESSVVPISEIQIGNKTLAHSLNSYAIGASKQLRDAKRLGRYLTSEKARHAPDSYTLKDKRWNEYMQHRRTIL